MEFKQIKASEIVEFARLCANDGSGILPITPWRAISQSVNPAVRADDILLVVAYDMDENVRGYIGILPSDLTIGKGKRIFWNTCWWVDPSVGAMVSMNLLSRFLQLTENRVAFSDLSETTQEIIGRLGGFQLFQREGILLRVRSGFHKRAESQRNRNPIVQLSLRLQLFRMIDGVINLFQSLRIGNFLEPRDDTWQVRWYEHMDTRHEKFIVAHSDSKMKQVDPTLFDWWVKHRWLATPDKSNKAIEKRYYFSSLSKAFTTKILEVTSDDHIIGIAICTFNNGVAKAHYLWYVPETEEQFFIALLDSVIVDSRTHTILSFHTSWVNFLQGSTFPLLYSSEVKRYFGFSNTLAKEINENDFQDGNGDYIFT